MKNLILITCDTNYSKVLNETIKNFQLYATKTKSDLKISYGGYPYIDRYKSIIDIEDSYDNIAYIDCDIFISQNAPNIFEQEYTKIALRRAYTHNNKYVFDVTEWAKTYFGDSFNSDYYCFGGLIVGRTKEIKFLSEKVVELWNNTDKTSHHYLMNDEIYLCQIVYKYFPDFFNLDNNWLRSTFIDIQKEQFYFIHPFVSKDEKIKHLKNLNSLNL